MGVTFDDRDVAALVNGSESYQPDTFTGTVPSYLGARDYTMSAGRGLSRADVSQHRKVAVLGPTVASSLLAGVGSTLRVNGTAFQVVGITASKGSNGVQDEDDVVLRRSRRSRTR